MDDMALFESRFAERLRAFASTGVQSVDSAALARAVAADHPRTAATRPAARGPGGGVHRALDRAVFGPRRIRPMSRIAIGAAVVALLVLGGAFLIQRGLPVVGGGPSATPGVSASPRDPASPAPSQPSSVVPARAPSWKTTGSMGTARAGHTAVRLLDGRVLVAGGGNGGAYDTSAELYDPRTGTWAVAKSMITGREHHTATLLRDGRVLVAGGIGSESDAPIPAELYDPGTGIWTVTGGMASVRYNHTATLLPDGKVLVAGGDRWPDDALDSAELYDPATGTWTATGSMLARRDEFTATLLSDGNVLVGGGTSGRPGSVEVYDQAAGTWTATGSWVIPGQTYRTATRLLDGRVLVTGRAGPDDHAAELYDADTEAWTATGNTVGDRRFAATATLLADGTVFVVGGIGSKPDGAGGATSYSQDSAELYDPSAGTWTATASMAAPRADHTATLLADGRVLVVGGGVLDRDVTSPELGAVTSAEIYDPGTGSP